MQVYGEEICNLEQEKTELVPVLSELFSCVMAGKPVVSVVGAGGKTNTVFALARELGGKKKRIAVTTTTHMAFEPEHGILLGEHEALPEALPWDTHPYLMVTRSMTNTEQTGKSFKSTSLKAAELQKLQAMCDGLLIEADGARRLPFKVPWGNEPVIAEGTNLILILVGLSAIGKPLTECALRLERLCEILDCEPDHILTEEDAAAATYQGYWKELAQRYPNAGLLLILNQADNEELRQSGERIGRLMEEYTGQKHCWIMTSRSSSERI